jgi:hypothetical protein
MHLLAIPFLLVGITSKIKHRKLVHQMDQHLSTLQSINISNLIHHENEAKVSGEILHAQRKGQD